MAASMRSAVHTRINPTPNAVFCGSVSEGVYRGRGERNSEEDRAAELTLAEGISLACRVVALCIAFACAKLGWMLMGLGDYFRFKPDGLQSLAKPLTWSCLSVGAELSIQTSGRGPLQGFIPAKHEMFLPPSRPNLLKPDLKVEAPE